MSNVEVSSVVSGASSPQHMPAGNFFGAIQDKRERCGAIFTDLRHTAPRKLPMHSHELAFFALLRDGLYGERYGRGQSQYGPLSLMFRPAGIPHQDEIGPAAFAFTKSRSDPPGKNAWKIAPPLWTLPETTSAAARCSGSV